MSPVCINNVPTLFLHIQKTAGSTLVNIVKESYGVDNVTSHGDYGLPPKEMSQINSATGVMTQELREKSFISGHFGFDFAQELIGERFSFTFLREPKSRIISLYYFCRTRDPNEYGLYKVANNLSFDNFLSEGLNSPDVKAFIWNNQTWQLAMGFGNKFKKSVNDYSASELFEMAIKNLDLFSYVGFTETFKNDRDFVLKSMNIPVPETNLFVNSGGNRLDISELNSKTLDSLTSLTELDSKLYEYAWNKYKRNF
jgi:hypothetical protein